MLSTHAILFIFMHIIGKWTVNAFQTIECVGEIACLSTNITCQNGTDCLLNCDGKRSCKKSIVTCGSDGYHCIINCNGQESCNKMTIHGGTGNLIIDTTYMRLTAVHCPSNGHCNITCTGDKSCSTSNISASTNTHAINIDAAGDYVLEDSRIKCGRNSACFVKIAATSIEPLKNLKMYALHGVAVDGVTIKCDGLDCGNYENSIPPVTYCGDNYDQNCTLIQTDNDYTWNCINHVSVCSNYNMSSIKCVGDLWCFQYDIQCAEGANCYIDCIGYRPCRESTIQCPMGGYDCIINCTGSGACSRATINGGIGNLVITTAASESSKHLFESIVNCPSNGSCSITCNGNRACKSLSISSEANPQELSIFAISGEAVLSFTTVICPIHSQDASCVIEIPEASVDAITGMQIYAVRGFNDVELTCDSLSCPVYDIDPPMLFCTEHYNQSCVIDQSLTSSIWKCSHDLDVCSKYLVATPTHYPTLEPTYYPSLEPVIRNDIPTFEPTLIPSTLPTIEPTLEPTPPTLQPTFHPSKQPSSPTIEPTKEPSQEPTYLTFTPSKLPTISSIDCKGDLSCYQMVVTCVDGMNCNFVCNGYRACRESTLNCASDGSPCIVNCIGQGTCNAVTINGGNGDLIVTGSSDNWNMKSAIINCPSNSNCTVICHEYQGCKGITLSAHNTTKFLKVKALNGEEVLQNAVIICPTAVGDGSSPRCNIKISSQSMNGMEGMEIYAVSGFNNAIITCDSWLCPNYSSDVAPKMYCTPNYQSSCIMEQIAFDNKWQCTNEADMCLAPTTHFIDCIGDQTCFKHAIQCQRGYDCMVECIGYWSCKKLILDCPDDGHDCVINCIGQGACNYATIRGGYGNLTIEGSQIFSLTNIEINCPSLGDCLVICNGEYGCKTSIIKAHAASRSLTVFANNKKALDESQIICPTNLPRGVSHACVIHTVTGAIDQMDVYAVEGFNDVIIKCTDILCEATADTNFAPRVHCGSNYGHSCVIKQSDNSEMFTCADETAMCNDILISTFDPTMDPTIDPTLDPTIDPTIDPTVDPTSDPTMDPTMDPTIDPTLDPTADPTVDPTRDPTHEPTYDPTNDPTRNPTKHPTTDPTRAPSSSPTFPPSDSPSQPPTVAPSFSPSLSPTRFPTVEDAFGEIWIDIAYDIKYISDNGLQRVAHNVFASLSDIQIIIGESYVFSTEMLGADLEYRNFEIVFVEINTISIDIANENDLQKITFDDLQNEGNKIWNPSHDTLNNVRLTTQIYIDSYHTGTSILVASERDDFQNKAQNKLETYFGNRVEFIVNPEAEELKIKTESKPDETEDYILYVSIIFISVTYLTAVGAVVFNKASQTKADDGKFTAITAYGLQVWDMISDVVLALEITYKLSDHEGNAFLLVSSVGSIAFVLIPFITNMVIAVNIKKFITNNAATSYFETKSSFFITLCTFSGSAYASLALISSGVFGLDIFNCGLTQYELMRSGKLKIFGTILIGNVPQMICQILYVYSLGDTPTQNTYLAFITSLASVISAILSYIINKSSTGHSTTIQYYIKYENKHSPLDEKNKKKVKQNCLKRKALRTAITSVLEIHENDIEIGFCTMTANGLYYHIVNHCQDAIAKIPQKYIDETYYKERVAALNGIFQAHFQLIVNPNEGTFGISVYSSLSPKMDTHRPMVGDTMDVLSTENDGQNTRQSKRDTGIEMHTCAPVCIQETAETKEGNEGVRGTDEIEEGEKVVNVSARDDNNGESDLDIDGLLQIVELIEPIQSSDDST